MATKYKCGKCGRKGHNKASCSARKRTKKKVKVRRKTKGGRGRQARRKCGKCNRVGHNKATCGSKKKTKKKTHRNPRRPKKAKKKKTRRGMTPRAITNRWGKVVARHKSKSSNKKYEVRRKGSSYSCNCPGWVFGGKPRSCRHTRAARSAGKKRNYSRFCRR